MAPPRARRDDGPESDRNRVPAADGSRLGSRTFRSVQGTVTITQETWVAFRGARDRPRRRSRRDRGVRGDDRAPPDAADPRAHRAAGDRHRPDGDARHGQGRRRPAPGRVRTARRADGPGLDARDGRPADRRPQPPGAPGQARGRARPRGPLPAPVLDRPRRPRPLQAGQRHARPHGRRCGPARGGRRAPLERAGGRPGRPLRRRGVHDRDARDRRRRRCGQRREASPARRVAHRPARGRARPHGHAQRRGRRRPRRSSSSSTG